MELDSRCRRLPQYLHRTSLGPFAAGFVSERTGSLAEGVIGNLAVVVPGLAALALAIASYGKALRSLTERAASAAGEDPAGDPRSGIA